MSTDATPDANFLDSITTPGAREFVERKGYASVDHLAIAALSSDKHISSTRRMSGDAIAIPGQNATDEDWSSFFSKVGRPERAEQYQLQFGDGVTVDNGFVDWAKRSFHDAGLSPRQANALVKAYTAYAGERGGAEKSAANAAHEYQVDLLKKNWGSAWDSNILEGKKAVAALGIDRSLADQLDTQLGTSGAMELLARLGRAVADGKVQIETKDAAAAKIEELKGNKAFQDSLRDRRHPKHAENKKAWNAAHSAATYGEAGTAPAKPAAAGSQADALQQEIAAIEKDPALWNSKDPRHSAVVERRNALYAMLYPPKG
jgi:hypothetical protein